MSNSFEIETANGTRGSYRVEGGMITVWCDIGRRRTQLGGAAGNPESLAKLMLSEIESQTKNGGL